ncbi:MAG TPA: hypothetical protein VH475_21735 [Tepidisphaeraceae bacterium]
MPLALFLSSVPLNRLVFPRISRSDWIVITTANVVFGLAVSLALLNIFGSPVRVAIVGKYATYGNIRFYNPIYAREFRVNAVNGHGALTLAPAESTATRGTPETIRAHKQTRPGGAGG